VLHWDDLERTLVRGGAAPRYARRLRDELADHRAALIEEHCAQGTGQAGAERAADDTLGDLESILSNALAGPGAQSLAHTQPSLVFLVAPLATALASLALAIGLAMGLAWVGLVLFGMAEDGRAFRVLANASYATIAFLIMPALAFLFCAEAWLNRASMRWAFAACLALGALGGILVLGYHVASPAAPGGAIYIGLGWEVRALRFALPILTFLAFAALVQNERGATMVRSLRRFAI
jgi:hypothetical protein